jgi:anthranilate synthase component 2/para-aminobenzoate synthetase component 2
MDGGMSSMIIVIDNYDSFAYNLVQMVGAMGREVKVFRNDRVNAKRAMAMEPDAIIVSPGPCTPDEAGNSIEVIRGCAGKTPILGVCLGHQCIARAFGGKIVRNRNVMHGKTSLVFHDGKTIYRGIVNPFAGMRYHSLAIEKESLPRCLEISALASDGTIMGVRHRSLPIEGVQFHPESFLTKEGEKIVRNFLGL